MNTAAHHQPAHANSSQAADDVSVLTRLYADMVLIRTVRETLQMTAERRSSEDADFNGPGGEAIAAGVVGALDPARDCVVSNHREENHLIAFNGDIRRLFASETDRPERPRPTRDSALSLQSENFFAIDDPQATCLLAAGIAMTEKAKGNDGVSIAFLRDNAMDQDRFGEVFALTTAWNLPVLWAIESNTVRHNDGRQESDQFGRAKPPGMKCGSVDGNDVLAVYRAALDAIGSMRADGGPYVLFLETPPPEPSSDGEHPGEILKRRLDDPLARAAFGLDPDYCTALRKRIAGEVAEILEVPIDQ